MRTHPTYSIRDIKGEALAQLEPASYSASLRVKGLLLVLVMFMRSGGIRLVALDGKRGQLPDPVLDQPHRLLVHDI